MPAAAPTGAAASNPGSNAAGAAPSGAESTEAPASGDTLSDEASSLPKATKLTVDFTTKSYGGEYGPVNLGVVWVEDASGKWVYTLEMWCGWQNTKSLSPYNMSGGADYSVGLFPGTHTTMPPSDVVTAATLRQHKTHSGAHWSFKDSDGKEVPDGMYKLMLEVTEQEDAGKVLEVPFMKGGPAGPVTAPDSPGFTNLKINLE